MTVHVKPRVNPLTVAFFLHLNKQVIIKVLDVDEPPVFTQATYHFTVEEERMMNHIGTVTASDPDKAKKSIRWETLDTQQP